MPILFHSSPLACPATVYLALLSAIHAALQLAIYGAIQIAAWCYRQAVQVGLGECEALGAPSPGYRLAERERVSRWMYEWRE